MADALDQRAVRDVVLLVDFPGGVLFDVIGGELALDDICPELPAAWIEPATCPLKLFESVACRAQQSRIRV